MASHRPEERNNLQIIVVNLNGNNSTIQEALRTVNTMMKRDSGGVKPGSSNGKGASKGLPNSKHVDESKEEEELGLFVDAEAVDESEISDESPATTPKPRAKPTIPKLVPELDFNSVTPTFRDYVTSKKPKDQLDWYLLTASWLKDHKQIAEIGINHIYTACKYIGADWTLYSDVGQPFRDGRRKGIFGKGTKKGWSVITHIGEDRIKRMDRKA